LGEIAKKTASGAMWTISTNLGSRAVSLVGTVMLTRYIDPSDYGEVMGASVMAGSALALSNLGLGQYLVARPKAGRAAAWHVTFYCTVICAVALGVFLIAGSSLGRFFKVTDVMRYLPWLAGVTLAERMVTVAERILYRDLRFKLVGIYGAAAEVLYSAVSLVLVMRGHGGMAIVWGNVARTGLRAVVIFGAVAWRDWVDVGPITAQTTREIFAFGLPLTPGAIAGFASRRWDNLLMSRFVGPAAMGAYNYAYNLADLPASQVGEQIGDLLLPSFGHLEPPDRRRGLVRAVGLLALIMFPMAVGLSAVAPTLVRAVFDERWAAVAPMLMILSALSLTRPIGYAVAAYLQSMGRSATLSALEIGKVLALFAGIVVLGPLGPLYICGAVGIAFTLHALAGLVLVRADGVPFLATLFSLGRPLLACVPMVGAVLAARLGLHRLGIDGHGGMMARVISVAAEIGAGGLAYVAAAFVVAGPIARDFLGLLRSVLRRGRG